jgi:hypothetical protein
MRPQLGRPGSRRFWSLTAVLAVVVGTNIGCGASAESASTQADSLPGAYSAGSPSSPSSASCAPEVGGLVPADIAPLEVQCPGGYTQRKSLAAQPIAGRFTTAAELTDAFCISKTGTQAPTLDPRAPSYELNVDFEKSDVVAYAFDTLAGVPALHERGDDLWLKVTTDKCGGNAPRLGTIAFAVPKDKKVNEQTCARACE